MGLSAQTPGKLSRFEQPPAAVHMPKAASPSWPSLRPSVPMAQRASEPTGPSRSTNKQAWQAGKARKPERRDP